MLGAYFRLEDDLYVENRWYLDHFYDDAGRMLDGREFRYGRPVDVGPPLRTRLWNEDKIFEAQLPLRLSLYKKWMGPPLDFTFTNEDVPVVTSKVANILGAIAGADIQRIPVAVESREDPYEIINVISRVDCIDSERSEIQWFKEGNSVRPDLAGMPEMITRLVVDPDRAGERNIFRLEGWKVAVIVSELVKNALEEARVSGVKFTRVSGLAAEKPA